MPSTIKDVARMTGLGLATISKYINGGSVRPENRELIEKAIRELDFRPNVYAQGLRNRRTGLVAMLIPDMRNPYFTDLVMQFESALSSIGYSVVLFSHFECKDDFRRIISELDQFHVDGLIMSYDGDDESMELLKNLNIPVVSINLENARDSFDNVLIDYADGTYHSMKCLIQKGRRSIAIVSAPSDLYQGREMMAGYRLALGLYGIEYRESLVGYADMSFESGYDATCRILDRGTDMDAFIYGSSLMALGGIRAMVERNITVDETADVVCFNDQSGLRTIFPYLFPVQLPAARMAEVASGILKKRMDGNNEGFPAYIRLETGRMDDPDW